MVAGCLLAVGCASQPDNIKSSYVSPVQYESYDCRQVQSEMQRVSHRASELRGDLKTKADIDAVQMGVGLVLFWPAIFFLEGGDGAEASEYARLKGEKEALEQAAIQKKCGVSFAGAGNSSSTGSTGTGDRFIVVRVQTLLKDKGFDPGPVNGRMTPETEKALKQFQLQSDIEPTGTITQKTKEALGI